MTIKVRDISKWAKLPEGHAINCAGLGLRRVKLEVNCDAPTRFVVIQGEASTFLAAVDSLRTIEFVVDGPCEVFPETLGEVWFYTSDGEVTAYEDPDAVTFTKIAGRRSRNPELEMMMFKAEQRMNARLESQRAEFEAYVARVGRHDPLTGEVDETENGSLDPSGNDGGEPVQKDGHAVSPEEGKSGGETGHGATVDSGAKPAK